MIPAKSASGNCHSIALRSLKM